MSQDWFKDVLEFHQKFGCVINAMPTIPDDNVDRLRGAMEMEEIGETHAAAYRGDLPSVADGIVDTIYVLIGRAVSYGIDLRPVWEAVHAANMAKTGGAIRDDGKILKPAGWVPPDVAGVLARQQPITMGNI